MRFTWIVVIGLTYGPAVSPAQDGRGPGRGRFPVFNLGFTTLDTNGDGLLDAQEIAAAPALLARLDKNSDAQISSDEARPAMPEGRGRGGPGGGREGATDENGGNVVEETVKALMAFDANGDGKLSRSELPERFQGIFDRGDENKDGFLTPEEIRKAAAAQAAPAGSGPGGRGGPEGRRGEGPRGDINFIRMDPILAAVDTNRDGVISAGELRNAAESIRKLDKDGDGKVTRDEAMPFLGRGRGF
jgi:Ca2+-binding EF-hand superfamily protein